MHDTIFARAKVVIIVGFAKITFKLPKTRYMRKALTYIGNRIRKLIDFFYPPFSRFISPQLFRYIVCGGSNLLFDSLLYYVVYNYVLHQQPVDLGFMLLRSDLAAFTIKFPITLFTGFLLQKYVTFSLANASRGRAQLFRYFIVVLINLCINYIGFHIFVDILHFFPSITNATISILTSIFSYIAQKTFTFRMAKK